MNFQDTPSRAALTRELVFINTPIRTYHDSDGIWFAACDVAVALEYARFDSNLAARVSDDWKGTKPIRTPGGVQNLICFNESGLNEFLMRCDKPAAVPFRRWIAGEVLPSIRQNGGYVLGQAHMSADELMASALLVAQRVLEQKTRSLAEAQPAIEFAEAVASSRDAISIGAFAQMIGTGQNRLFKTLRDMKILQSDNRPFQRYQDAGYFRVVERFYDKPNQEKGLSWKTLITGTGQVWLSKKLNFNQ